MDPDARQGIPVDAIPAPPSSWRTVGIFGTNGGRRVILARGPAAAGFRLFVPNIPTVRPGPALDRLSLPHPAARELDFGFGEVLSVGQPVSVLPAHVEELGDLGYPDQMVGHSSEGS